MTQPTQKSSLISTLQAQPFSLVLSGGAALGSCHLGVLKFLEMHALHPSEIIGTSMGALLGGAYACGLSASEIEDLFRTTLSAQHAFRTVVRSRSLKVMALIRQLFSDVFGMTCLTETTIPFYAVATIAKTGLPYCFHPGEKLVTVAQAVQASTAVPGVFPAVEVQGQVFVDGFVCGENLPVEFASQPVILAVDALASNTRALFQQPTKSLAEQVECTIRTLIQATTNTRKQNVACRRDVRNLLVIEPELQAFKSYQLHRWEEIMLRGGEAAKLLFQI